MSSCLTSRLPAAFAVALACALPAGATTIDFSVLQTIPAASSAHTYAGFDASGTTLHVAQNAGASMNPLFGAWPGLWLGGSQDSDRYGFTFNKAVTFIEFYITAQSTAIGLYSEVFNAFSTNAPSTASFVNLVGTAWDGANLTSSVEDGRSRIRFTSIRAAGFSSIAFDHLQTGAPYGSVIEEIQFSAVVPEPASYALMLAGLTLLGSLARRRR